MDERPRRFMSGLLSLGLLTALWLPVRYARVSSATGPSPVQATRTVPRGRESGCAAEVTSTLSTQKLRLCDQAEVSLSAWPACPTCPGGIHVVFVQLDVSSAPAWMNDESVAVLRQLMVYRGQEMRVGVVHYNSSSVRRVLPMTDTLQHAIAALNAPRYGRDPHGDFVGAARMALDLLQDARKQHERATGRTGEEPCEYVVFFASTSSAYVADEANLREAGQMISRKGVVLLAGCPESSAEACRATKDMPEPKNYYSDATLGAGRLQRNMANEMDELQQRYGLRSMSVSQTLPPGLRFVEGSASEAPTVTMLPDQSVRLSWDWSRLQRTELHSVTYRVQPLQEGTWTIGGLVTLRDKDNKTRELSAPELSLTVAGDCIEPTPTSPPTATDIPPATDTPAPPPTSTSTPTRWPILLPWTVNGG